ncbi:MAG: PAS domain S-box protein, partial [Acidobacteriales bacterium]|nr:PAS domain S-box protein [Terriglobales bacterium]
MTEYTSVAQTSKTRSYLRQIAIALSTIVLALLVKFLLLQMLPLDYPFLIFFTAVVVSAWFGGLTSGLLATLLSAVLVRYFFIEPTNSFALNGEDLAQLLIFCFEGGLISIVSYRLHRAYYRAMQDVARHERTEQSLRESEEHIRLLIEGVKEYAIFMLDPNGIIKSWNTGAERAKGYTASEIIGKPLAILYTPEDAAAGKPQRLMQKAITDGSAEDEGWRVRKDGSRFWANVTLTALWEHGELRGFAKITRDMTERRHAEELTLSLERERIARAEAERANALKMRFLAMISHELRTPLTSIKGFTSTLLAEDVTWVPEQQRQFLSLVDEEADRLRELIDQLLDLSQIQAGVLQIQAIAQPFSASLDVAREQLRTLTVNQDFQANVPEHLPTVLMDERRIAQVVTNIIGNAVKYAPLGTPIVLT